jgi:hypothetical protein
MHDPRTLFLPSELRPKAEPFHRIRIGRLSPGEPETPEIETTDTRMTGKRRSDSSYRIRTRRSPVA